MNGHDHMGHGSGQVQHLLERLTQVAYDQLQIDVETYEQAAAHTLFVTREADLRAGDRRLSMLDAEMGQARMLADSFLGGLLCLLLDVFLVNLPIAAEWKAAGSFLILAGACGYLGIWLRGTYRRRTAALRAVRRSIEEARDLYALHSELAVRLQNSRHEHVREDTLLRSLLVGLGSETAGSNVSARRRHLDEIARIDRQLLLDRREYECNGGDFWLHLLRAALTYRLPGFVPAFVVYAQQGRAFAEWRAYARELAAALASMRRLEDYECGLGHRLSDPETAADLQRLLHDFQDYGVENLARLLRFCRVRLGYHEAGVPYPSAEQFQELIARRVP